MAGSCEHGDEPLGSIKGGQLLDSFSRRTLFHEVSQLVIELDKVFIIYINKISHFYLDQLNGETQQSRRTDLPTTDFIQICVCR
jgi:hypothetical protein